MARLSTMQVCSAHTMLIHLLCHDVPDRADGCTHDSTGDHYLADRSQLLKDVVPLLLLYRIAMRPVALQVHVVQQNVGPCIESPYYVHSRIPAVARCWWP